MNKYLLVIGLFMVLIFSFLVQCKRMNTKFLLSLKERNAHIDSLNDALSKGRILFEHELHEIQTHDRVLIQERIIWKERVVYRRQELAQDTTLTNHLLDSLLVNVGAPDVVFRAEDYEPLKRKYFELATLSIRKNKALEDAKNLLREGDTLFTEQRTLNKDLTIRLIKEKCKVGLLFTRKRLWTSKSCVEKNKQLINQ